MLSVFFCVFCVWFGVLCLFFVVLLFLGSLFEKFSGANFCFWVSWLVLCFSIVFCLGFCSIVWFFAPENVSKNSLHVRSAVFRGLFLSLSLVFRRRRLFVFFCFFQERKLRANRSHPTPHCFGLVFFLFLSPPHRVYLPFWPCVLSFSRFVGVPFWAPGVFFWILLEHYGA